MSTFFIDEKIDTGEMILQQAIPILENENAGSLHDKLMCLGSELVLNTVALIAEGNVKTTPQPENQEMKSAFKLNKDNCKIDWDDCLDNIYNKVRGLSPYPAAWCVLKNGEDSLDIKIYDAEKEIEAHNLEIGKLVTTKKEIKVVVKAGYINIKEIKLPGKRKMDVKSLLNGYNFDEKAKML